MKIEQIAVSFPSQKITNDDVVDLIAGESGNFSGDLSATLELILRILKMSGASTRYWLGSGESPLSLMVEACTDVMGGLGRSDRIDLVIYASLHPELIEPSTANLIAHKIGLDFVECFDVKAGCDSWMKAVKLSSVLIGAGAYKRIMIVSGEFPMIPHMAIYPKLFALSHPGELEWRFPAFTLGEAASATILAADPENEWTFCNATRNDLFDLCTVVSPSHDAYPISSSRVAKDGVCTFTSYGAELRSHGLPMMVELFKKSGIDPCAVDVLFTHSSSKSDWHQGAKSVGLGDKIYDIYARYGNVVSVAIPAAIALAAREGRLRRGQRVAVLSASAGMSFSASSFRF